MIRMFGVVYGLCFCIMIFIITFIAVYIVIFRAISWYLDNRITYVKLYCLMLLFNPYTFYVQIIVSCLYFYMCLFHHLIFLLDHVILILNLIYLIVIYDDGIIFVCIILYFFIRIIFCIRDPCIFYGYLNSFSVTALSNLILYLFIISFDIFVYLNLIFSYLYFTIKTVLDDKHQ